MKTKNVLKFQYVDELNDMKMSNQTFHRMEQTQADPQSCNLKQYRFAPKLLYPNGKPYCCSID